MWEFERGSKSGVVDWCDTVDSKADAEQDQSRMEGFGRIGGGSDEGVGVDVAVVGPDVYMEFRRWSLGNESSV
jgi:hypothetical protein